MYICTLVIHLCIYVYSFIYTYVCVNLLGSTWRTPVYADDLVQGSPYGDSPTHAICLALVDDKHLSNASAKGLSLVKSMTCTSMSAAYFFLICP